MGKAKKPRKSDARKAVDPTSRPKKFVFNATPETDALYKNKVAPAAKALASANAADRAGALSTICNDFLDDDAARFLLLKGRIVQKLMEDLVHDPAEDVVVLAWAALRKIAAKEGYDHCVNMFRKDILSSISPLLGKLVERIGPVAADPSMVDGKPVDNLWLLAESVIGLLKCLSEESEQALDAISNLDLIPFLMGLLNPSAQVVPENIKALSAQCLSSLTEDNDEFTVKLLGPSNYIPQLLQLKDAESPVIRISACAILHNVSLATTELEHNLSDSQILPTLTAFVKYTGSLDLASYDPSNSSRQDEAGILATQVALEIIASIATALGYELEGAKSNAVPDPEFLDEGPEKDGDEEEMADDGDDGDISAFQEDMEMVTAGDENNDDLGSSGTEGMTKYLLENTAPAVIVLSRPLPAAALSTIQLRALSALNNISWTLNAAIPSRSRLSKKWRKHTDTIWETVVAPVLTANTADVALAAAVTSVGWAAAKAAEGNVDLHSNTVHKAFMGLYRAATNDELRGRCVGVLGALAMPQDRIEVNKDIGVFLLGIISTAPDAPAEPVVEALNAMFDIYGDGDFKYDGPVFIQHGFLQYLEDAQQKVRKMVRRVNKTKFPELHLRADEAAENLKRFVAYKKKEQAKK